MVSAQNVAEYFLYSDGQTQSSEGISNLKLQKLVYYAQGFYMAIFGEPLFDEEISAWTHGPVVESLYHTYKENGKNPIPAPEIFDSTEVFTDDQLRLLEEIEEVFGQFSAWALREMTHEEKPWKDHEELSDVIPKDEILEYFLTRIN